MTRVLFALLAVGALALFIRATIPLPSLHVPTVATLIDSTKQAAYTQPAAPILGASGYMDITGVMLIENAGGTAIPYIQYSQNGGIATKQLVYDGIRPCAAQAGDLPCVGRDESSGYPQIPNGTVVRVRGMRADNRLIVDSIDIIASAS